ncbi:hypothetical protein [Sphingomonas phyllosphaerae]|uniref:hypothetical protein n=1 Tax=Sphingomonas phyllosphaerae TaxID=257003 RepID=UPI0024139DAA|nr:hypothetical protein [Sphingomonas phyllosphaerae]
MQARSRSRDGCEHVAFGASLTVALIRADDPDLESHIGSAHDIGVVETIARPQAFKRLAKGFVSDCSPHTSQPPCRSVRMSAYPQTSCEIGRRKQQPSHERYKQYERRRPIVEKVTVSEAISIKPEIGRWMIPGMLLSGPTS